jgi:hypothetical protein
LEDRSHNNEGSGNYVINHSLIIRRTENISSGKEKISGMGKGYWQGG